MFLRSLTIRGFKSFADKTVLEFVPGTSVIVGPNGSGKSNLVDAISWVLGEQGPRALRGGQMADVIFSGTSQRPALGMAEVKLLIDNGAGTIPLPMSEIEIGRTIFRNGESEYRINGELVRLLDVQEILSESGIGRALHTIVGQGQLEEVLHSRPEDRRVYIEEAAGIAKHRRRKERAERKLEGLDGDLLRLQDVLAELKRQLKPLRQQAETAKRHEDLTTEARRIAELLEGARLRALRAEREGKAGGWEAAERARAAAREHLDDLSERVGAAADERARATWALQQADAALGEAQDARSAAEVALRHAVEEEAGARGRLSAGSTSGARVAALEEEASRGRRRIEDLERELVQAASALESADRAYRVAVEERSAAEASRRRLLEDAAARRAEMETLRATLAASDRDHERAVATLGDVRGRLATARSDRDRLVAEGERLDAESGPLAERRTALEAERGSLLEQIADLESRLRRAENTRDVAAARLADLHASDGRRFLDRHAGAAVGILGDMVRASAGYEAALAAALGPAADAVVYEDGSAALRDAADGGGATLAIAGGAAAAAVLEGERPLLSVVTADGPARGIVGVLLADVYLADDLQAAVRGAASSRTSFVTRDGMLVGPVTIRTASDRAARATVLERDVRDAEHDVAGTTGALQPLRHRLEAVDAELAATVARIDEADRSLTALADRVGLLDGHVEGLEREETLLAERIAGMDEAAAAWRDRLETAPNDAGDVPALPPVPEAPVAAKVAVEAFRQERTTVQGRLAEIDREVAALGRQDPAALSGDLQAAEERRAAAEEALRGAASTATEAAAARTRAATAQTEAVDAEATLNKEWRDASSGLEQLRESYEDQDRARADLERRIRDAERMIREGYGREPDEVLADLADDETIATLERKAELVQRRLGLLGRVNLLAGGELEALQERHDFLDRELDDVKKARRDLLEVIRRIEEEIVETFSSAYRDVAAEFERLFASLFPGGEGRLVATEPTDLLTTGIEIEARPPGKRMKRLSLLSGGEKALTSIAFLFAIFRSRPSPFYLMDEVEPALDDVNLHRFIKLIDGFAKDAQVLIVTHQKRTMEIANMLYGVSMSRDGTTKVVCQKVDAPGSTAPDDASGLVPEAGPVA